MKDVLVFGGIVIGGYAGIVVLVAAWIWGGPALPLASILIAWPVAAFVTIVVFVPLVLPLTRWEDPLRRRLPGSVYNVISMTPFAVAIVASFAAVFILWTSMVGAPPRRFEMDSSMPTDLTDWVAITVAGLIGVLFVWEYRRLSRKWPRDGGGD